MKNLFKITDAKIIIILFVMASGLFIGVAIAKHTPEKTNTDKKTFVGIDAAGYAHYPNGETELTGKY